MFVHFPYLLFIDSAVKATSLINKVRSLFESIVVPHENVFVVLRRKLSEEENYCGRKSELSRKKR